jgi:hypothetical protein
MIHPCAIHCAVDATASLAGEPSTGTLAAPESPAPAEEGFDTAPTVAAWGQPAVAPAWGQPGEAAAPQEVEAAGDLPASLSSSLAETSEPQLVAAGAEAELAQPATDGDAAAEGRGAADAAGAEVAPAGAAADITQAATDAAEGDGVEEPGSPSDSLVLHGSVNHTLLMPGKGGGWHWLLHFTLYQLAPPVSVAEVVCHALPPFIPFINCIRRLTCVAALPAPHCRCHHHHLWPTDSGSSSASQCQPRRPAAAAAQWRRQAGRRPARHRSVYVCGSRPCLHPS